MLIENCFDNASYPRTKSGVDDGTEAVAEEVRPSKLTVAGAHSSLHTNRCTVFLAGLPDEHVPDRWRHAGRLATDA